MKRITAILLTLTVLVPTAGCLSIGVNTASITLGDPVPAQGVDADNNPIGPTNEFKSSDKRMWVAISAKAPAGTSIGYRWYFGDKLIVDDRISLNEQGRAAIYLQPPSGGSFPVGDYRVELYLVKSADKVVSFKVVP